MRFIDIDYEKRDGVARITINRPEVYNALRGRTTDEMVEATVVKRGEFAGADSFHKGEGTATIYSLPDGSRVLRMESFKVTNGPDLRVVLTPHADPAGRDDVHQTGYSDIGKLKGNIGSQNYPIVPYLLDFFVVQKR